MTNVTPQLTPAELATETSESEVVPDMEPGADVAETVEESGLTPPDVEPPATETGTEGSIVLSEGEELVIPEFSPAEAGVLELEEEELVQPEEAPPSD